MVTSRNVIAAVLAAVCVPASASAGPIRGKLDLPAHGRPVPGRTAHAAVRTHPPRRYEATASHRVASAPGIHGKVHAANGLTHAGPAAGSHHVTTGSHHAGRQGGGPPIAPVPEPSGVALAVSGIAAFAFAARKRKGRNG